MKGNRGVLAAGALVFVLALLVRGLYLADGVALLYTTEQDGTRMARRYDETALSILRGEGILFPKVRDPARTGLASRPPGYSMFLALIYRSLGRSFPLVSAVQDVLTAAAVLLVFGFAARTFGLLAGLVAGVLTALSPHIAATSNLILADAIASLPLLFGFWVALPAVTAPTSDRSQLVRLCVLGLALGAGTWLRPNVILLGPFAGLFLFFLLGRSKRAFLLSTLVAAISLLAVVPITLRNAIVFGEFVPVSINGGITLWQGVADAGGREYGARMWDKQVMAEEAERYGRPDYLLWWAEPDGIARDRDRYRRAMDVIKARPLWYATAMVRRMGLMLSFYDGPEALFPAGVRAVPDGDRIPLTPAPEYDVRIDEARFASRVGFADPLRGPLRAIHGLWLLVPVLCLFGVFVALGSTPRAALFWLIVPAYYLIFESPFLYEWRVAVPMQYFLLPFGGKAVSAVGQRFITGPA